MTILGKKRAIDHLNLSVPNIEEAKEYYTKTLNFEVIAEFNGGGLKFAFVSDGTIVYELLENTSLEKAIFEHIAYVSDDIEADYNYFKETDSSLLTTEIGHLDFLFENGIKYFFIKGAADERIEFIQVL